MSEGTGSGAWRMPASPYRGSWRLDGRFWPTVRDDPADAEAISHKLSVRAGLVRQLAAGLYTVTPMGLRVIQRVEAIIREEMNHIGAQELLMPVMHPAEIWEATGRYGLSEQFRLEDRGGRKMVLGMTHEEIVTWHAARELRSYRDLPQSWYQIQTKLRDEPRPKSGMLRVREFTMKDSYSFDADEAGLEKSYEAHSAAYARIFDRSGLLWYRVESDVGMMGGSGAHEYMAPSPSGEDVVARTASGSYAANVELAVSVAREPDFGDGPVAPEEFATGASRNSRGSRASTRQRSPRAWCSWRTPGPCWRSCGASTRCTRRRSPISSASTAPRTPRRFASGSAPTPDRSGRSA
jgi:prolyl-tRNA synthetase